MQSGIRLQHHGPPGQRTLADGSEDLVTPRPIEPFHPPQMPGKITTLQKPGQHILLQRRHGGGIKGHSLRICRHKLRRQHQIADAEGGRDGLGEGIEIDRTATGVQTLQWRNGFACEAELTVVIVLQNKTVRRGLTPAQ